MRLSVCLSAVAITVMLPAVTLAAPPGRAVFTPVYRPAPVSDRRSSPERDTKEDPGSFKVPFDVHVEPRPLPESGDFALRRWRAVEWNAIPIWHPGACLGSGPAWAAPGGQAAWTAESPQSFTIGSLAGDPSRSLLSSNRADNAAIDSLTSPVPQPSNALSFQYGLQPACGAPNFTSL